MTRCSVVVHIFSFYFEGTGKGEMFVNNEYMHEYTVYVLGVPDFASHPMIGHWRWCPRWSSPEMFWQKRKNKQKDFKNINQLDGLETNLKFCTVLRFFYRQQCKSESLRILKPFVSWTVEVSDKAPYSAFLKWGEKKKKMGAIFLA